MESQFVKRAETGTKEGWQHSLPDTKVGDKLHFGQPFQCGSSRIGGAAFVVGRGNVTVRQSGVVVSGPNDSVKINFACGHRFRGLRGLAGINYGDRDFVIANFGGY